MKMEPGSRLPPIQRVSRCRRIWSGSRKRSGGGGIQVWQCGSHCVGVDGAEGEERGMQQRRWLLSLSQTIEGDANGKIDQRRGVIDLPREGCSPPRKELSTREMTGAG
ncbi:unnamed protein product [Linum trigynum]|uniref:Uncharacterized protein n=1 Tax=Linum trigynum TaxID=586398 RepID=A0AAV2EUZ8_9ROSI